MLACVIIHMTNSYHLLLRAVTTMMESLQRSVDSNARTVHNVYQEPMIPMAIVAEDLVELEIAELNTLEDI